jgi:hypothetical protein
MEGASLAKPSTASSSAHLPVFSSTSAPEVGCSITSAATISTAGRTGKRPFRATFFAGADLGLARFAVADFTRLRGLLRLADVTNCDAGFD